MEEGMGNGECMKVLSLFSGGGIGDYGLTLAGMEIVGQVEIDDYCQKILSLRWPEVPKWRDIRDVKGAEVIERCGAIDLISGGFPCQDISLQGIGAGIEGKRSGLWSEMFRLICEIRPRFILVENVSALLSRGIDRVLGDLAEVGYDTEWDCISASTMGLCHIRERVWIVAYLCGSRFQRFSFSRSVEGLRKERQKQLERLLESERKLAISTSSGRGIHDGASFKMDRLKLLGNGQVVQVVEWIGKRIMEYESRTEPKL
jgi:DNA (cytosine-5)-methyltransferase 1